jgi:plasmid stability protein
MLRCMKRTTIAMDDGVFGALRQRAAREGISLKDLVNGLLRKCLAAEQGRSYRLNWRPVKGKGLQPGVDIDDRKSLLDRMGGR